MKKMIWKPVTACALSLVLLAGCAQTAANGSTQPAPQPTAAAKAVGTVLLSVNPEIEVSYDDKGLVLEVEGRNDDGRSVAGGYTGYEGRSCEEVVNELVREIHESGYFQEGVAGRDKNIVIKLEEGSAYPGDDFLEDVAQGVRDAVREIGMASQPMTVEEKDLDGKGYIGLDKAKELVLGQLGLDEASFTDREYELDDGVYELEFTADGVAYEFEVNAVNGKVQEADYDHNDDWDDDADDIDDADDQDDRDDDIDDVDDQDDRDDDIDDVDDQDDQDDDIDDVDDQDDWDDDIDDVDDQDDQDDDIDDVDDQDDWDDDIDDVDDQDDRDDDIDDVDDQDDRDDDINDVDDQDDWDDDIDDDDDDQDD